MLDPAILSCSTTGQNKVSRGLVILAGNLNEGNKKMGFSGMLIKCWAEKPCSWTPIGMCPSAGIAGKGNAS